MTAKKTALIFILLSLIAFGLIGQTGLVLAEGMNQQPTIAIPTVTGTPEGVMVSVSIFQEETVNIRSGPNAALYDKVGVLLPGQKAAVLGRTAGGDWVMIEYPVRQIILGGFFHPWLIFPQGKCP